MSSEFPADIDRRGYLAALVGTGAASLAGCSLLEGDEDSPTASVDEGRARELAERFAPTLYFDAEEKWFPTDPRRYESERDGSPVVSGFDAFDGYSKRYNDPSSPPDPTVFYHVVEYDGSPLSVVQFWQYSAFDQFTTNFHWHDWEVLHVFVDTDSDEPQLYVASSHSRKVPNNEYLDPDPETVPRILSELGSHSSALSLNDSEDRFQRLADGGGLADITNSAIESIEDVASIPFAYGLPRDEGSRLPYIVPEYDGEPLYEHDDLPSVERADLVPDELTVSSFSEITSPPSDLSERTTGLVFDHSERDGTDADIGYDLVPTSEIEDITDFTGPQLSFEFSVPEFGEDAFAGHISTTGAPWGQSRYTNPAADISEPNHRSTLSERYDAIGEAAGVNTVIATISDVVPDDDAPEDDGVTTEESDVEGVALLKSDPEAVPTFGGIVAVTDVESGDHELTINRSGSAPHGEQVSVADDDDPTLAGVDSEIPLVARENARKIEIDPDEADSDLTTLAVEDDFGGKLYDASLDGKDSVYVHDGGAYTTEIKDSDEEVGAFRVNPDPASDETVSIDSPNTGKESLATFIVDISTETRDQVSDATDDDETQGRENSVTGLIQALDAVIDAAEKAAQEARDGNKDKADQQLSTVATRLENVTTRLTEASDDLSEPLSTAAEKRLEQATTRNEQAENTSSL